MNSKENELYDFAKMMYGVGQSIRAYVVLNFITADQYKEITGEDYVASTSESPSDSASASTSASEPVSVSDVASASATASASDSASATATAPEAAENN